MTILVNLFQDIENISITNFTFISLYRQRNEPKKATRNDASARSGKLLEIIQK